MFSNAAKDEPEINLKNSGPEVVDKLYNAANQAGRKVRSAFDSANEEFSHASDKVTTEIRANPVQSSIIALGIGVVLGVLIRR